MNLESIGIEVCTIARRTGEFIRNEGEGFRVSSVVTKGLNDFVSYVDKQSEDQIKAGLELITPGCGFIAEESEIENSDADCIWIIDPLDGTTNFIHGLPCYCVSIALQYKGDMVLGVIYEINLDELFYAWKGGGAWLNYKPIQVSQTEKVSESLIATGFPYHDFTRLTPYLELFRELLMHTHGVRRIGSAAADMAYVACGRFDTFYEYSLKPWDVAAGIVIVREAGGIISDFSGQDNCLNGAEMIASNSAVFSEFLDVVKRYF
jgi:myo-inositol-1(or 4)-monophosphatase